MAAAARSPRPEAEPLIQIDDADDGGESLLLQEQDVENADGGQIYLLAEEQRQEIERLKSEIETLKAAPPQVHDDITSHVNAHPFVGFLLLTSYLAHWSIVCMSPLAFDGTLNCKGRVPNSTNALFFLTCWMVTIIELTLASSTTMGKRVMATRWRLALMVALSQMAKMDAYGDSTFVMIARDCGSVVFYPSLISFICGVVIGQVIPGFYFLFMFVTRGRYPYQAILYLEMNVLAEAISPSGRELDIEIDYVKLATDETIPLTPDGTRPTGVAEAQSAAAVGAPESGTPAGAAQPQPGSNGSADAVIDFGRHPTDEQRKNRMSVPKTETGKKVEAAPVITESADSLNKRLRKATEEKDVDLINEILLHFERQQMSPKPELFEDASAVVAYAMKVQLIVTATKKILLMVRFLGEDLIQNSSQAYFLAEKWNETSDANKWFTIASIVCGLGVSFGGPIKAWLDHKESARVLESTIESCVDQACGSMKVALVQIPALIEGSSARVPFTHPRYAAIKACAKLCEQIKRTQDVDKKVFLVSHPKSIQYLRRVAASRPTAEVSHSEFMVEMQAWYDIQKDVKTAIAERKDYRDLKGKLKELYSTPGFVEISENVKRDAVKELSKLSQEENITDVEELEAPEAPEPWEEIDAMAILAAVDSGFIAERQGLLPRGQKCRYQSSTYGWLPAIVQLYNDSDGTYDLDVRQHAKLENIAPITNGTARDAWPPGTLVSYHSSSVDRWLPATVVSFNDSDGTYNLDLREHADCERIRARGL